MKNIKIFAMVAMAATIFASCSKDGGNTQIENGKARLVIQLAGIQPATRTVEAAGEAGKLTLSNGHIFVLDVQGNVVDNTALVVAEANVTEPNNSGATGQVFPRPVPSDSKVYILGNIPSDVTVANLTTFELIQKAESALSVNTDYKTAAMANITGVAVALGTPEEINGEMTSTVQVSLSPLYSRLELAKVTGGPDIVSFEVAGVYVDSYYPSFNLVGGGAGTLWAQAQSTDFTGNIGLSSVGGPWSSTTKVAKPDSGVWAYHVGAGSVPRLIVHLQKVVYKYVTSAPGAEITTYEDRELNDAYLTVTGYTQMSSGSFQRGKIYQVADIPFNISDGGYTPNPTNVDLIVKVTVTDWSVTALTPEL